MEENALGINPAPELEFFNIFFFNFSFFIQFSFSFVNLSVCYFVSCTLYLFVNIVKF
jgi:hypothetical protein